MYSSTSSAFLTNERLRALAPAIFAESQHASRSDRYQYIPTTAVLEGMAKEGFLPVKVSAANVREADRKSFGKHMIRFRRIDQAPVTVGGIFPEVVMINSHDGTSSYRLSLGLYRLVCSNGLCVQQGGLEDVRVSHMGRNVIDDVIEGSYRVISDSATAIETVGQWSQLQLTDGEQTALAIGAHHARFADADGKIETPITPAQLLTARRTDDRKSDLWTTFNRVQENAVKGGLHAYTRDANGRRRRIGTREVKGIDGNVGLNRALWAMAEHLAKIKTGAVTLN